jgi:hypothetical protein
MKPLLKLYEKESHNGYARNGTDTSIVEKDELKI